MSRNQIVGGVLALLLLLFVALSYLILSAPAGTPPDVQADTPGATPPAGGTETATPRRERALVLYFQGMDVGLLFPEERVVIEATDANAQARQVLDELGKGPSRELLPTVPTGARVREVYFDANGVAYVDYTSALRDNHPGGSAEELLTIDSIVSSLTRNVPQVQAVRFLVEGRPVATLAGHVDLTVPIRPIADRLAVAP